MKACCELHDIEANKYNKIVIESLEPLTHRQTGTPHHKEVQNISKSKLNFPMKRPSIEYELGKTHKMKAFW